MTMPGRCIAMASRTACASVMSQVWRLRPVRARPLPRAIISSPTWPSAPKTRMETGSDIGGGGEAEPLSAIPVGDATPPLFVGQIPFHRLPQAFVRPDGHLHVQLALQLAGVDGV